MYEIKIKNDLALNSKLLLNAHPEAFEKCLTQQNIDPNDFQAMMNIIREWYQKEQHLPEAQLCDQMIAKFLYLRKFSTEQVKKSIDHYYTVRPKMAEFLKNRDPMDPILNKYLKTGYWIIMPQTTPDTCRVTLFRTRTSEGVCLLHILKVLCMMVEYRIMNDNSISEEIILDYSNMTVQLASQMTPVLAAKILYYLTCVGTRVNGIHVVNMPPVCAMILPIFKKIMKAKVLERMHFYKTLEDVLRRFPKNIFPKDLGGSDDLTCQDITDNWERTLSSAAWRKFFVEQDSIQTDESKRIIRNNFQDDFGLDGSFKRLNID